MGEDPQPYEEDITADPWIMAGNPVVRGTRIAVSLVLEELAQSPDINERLAAYPDLTRTDVQTCLAYAALQCAAILKDCAGADPSLQETCDRKIREVICMEINMQMYSAQLRGILNDQEVSIVGSGILDADKGVVIGQYFLRKIPPMLHPLVFNSVLITGYPSVCGSLGMSNPFYPGSYSYSRVVEFGENGRISYSAHCIEVSGREGSRLETTFEIEGNLITPPLRGCRPVLEIWTPKGADRIAGSFSIVWETNDGETLTGVATTDYIPPPANRLLFQTPRQRNVFIHSGVAGKILDVEQRSTLVPIG